MRDRAQANEINQKKQLRRHRRPRALRKHKNRKFFEKKPQILYTPRSLAQSDSTRRIWPHTVRQHLIRPRQCVYLHLFSMCYIWPRTVFRPHQTATAWQTAPVCTGYKGAGDMLSPVFWFWIRKWTQSFVFRFYMIVYRRCHEKTSYV